jgi:murein DD-endopeptidase MepM/ murein hydrolase activator NlpD
MKQTVSKLRKVILTLYLLTIHFLAGLFVYQIYVRAYFNQTVDLTSTGGGIADPTEKNSVPTPQPIPSIVPVVTPETAETDSNSQPENLNRSDNNSAQNNVTSESPDALMIPVVGIKREQLQDTFTDARSAGRVHNAIDIMAPLGTPVVAVADGEIAKFFDSQLGGITIYQYSTDRRLVYYYAHLQKRADNLKEKDFVKRGTVIGFVGDTGNAGAGNWHLHFSIAELADPKRFWEGNDINPFPILKNGIESR